MSFHSCEKGAYAARENSGQCAHDIHVYHYAKNKFEGSGQLSNDVMLQANGDC